MLSTGPHIAFPLICSVSAGPRICQVPVCTQAGHRVEGQSGAAARAHDEDTGQARPEDLGPVAHRSEQRIDLPEPVAVDEVRQDAAQRRCGEGGEDDAEIAGTARGVATAARHQSAHTLERLIGTGRAALLRALERPATSSELAVKLRQSLSTIGGHLTALRLTDLVVGTRVGRRVVYRRTEPGDLLAGHRED
ncbi:hypothetical protein ACWDBF_23205 [Streptomyces angustmyceticus]